MTERDEDVLARLPAHSFRDTGYRHQRPGFDPVSGAGARRRGGRYNPPHSFAVLYLALSPELAADELRKAAQRLAVSVSDSLPQELYAVNLELDRVIDLRTPEALEALSVTRDELTADNQLRSRQIGTAASQLGIQALITPSAAGAGDIVAVYVDNLGTGKCEPRLVETWSVVKDVPHRDAPPPVPFPADL